MSKSDDRIQRLLDTPLLARAVPHLRPETLHQLIRSLGLDASGELIAAATPDQLTAVLDLDLWPSPQPGRDEHFDDDRFAEWLELLVDAGEEIAVRTVAAIDENLMVAGLSRYVRVFDPGTFERTVPREEVPFGTGIPAFDGLQCEIGGYLVRARRTSAWDAVMKLLLALDTHHGDCFHSLMRGCRRLSNSAPEIDGLDDLLMAPAQQFHDLAIDRERRRSLQGYATPADARAFLQAARQRRPDQPGETAISPLATAYFRDADEAASVTAARSTASDAHSISVVVELLAEAGLVPELPVALLEGGPGQPSRLTRISALMAYLHGEHPLTYLRRSQELAFLTNTLLAGCSLQSRAFTVREASEAAVSVCNLGVECGAAMVPDSYLADHDLVTVFETGWAILHRDVSLFVAARLIATLTDLKCVDSDIQRDLYVLRRELVRQHHAGTPWRVRHAMDVLAMLDATVAIGVLGLIDECPVLPAAVTANIRGHAGAVSATAFEFISTTGQLHDVRAFMDKLPSLLDGS